jgi:hypothetical protein
MNRYFKNSQGLIIRFEYVDRDGNIVCQGLFSSDWWELQPISSDHFAANTIEITHLFA